MRFLLTPHPGGSGVRAGCPARNLASPASAPLMPRPGTSASDARLAKEKTAKSATGWKLTLPCTRDEAEAIGELDVATLGLDPPSP